MKKIAVLGSSGMLGATMAEVLRQEEFEVVEFNRQGKSKWKSEKAVRFEVDESMALTSLHHLSKFDVVVNAVGLIRQIIDENDENCVQDCHLVNSFFPLLLDEFSLVTGVPVIQIGTDCVFSGNEGEYLEDSIQEYSDLYSFTKCVGENLSINTNILRSSVIGLEDQTRVSLLSWVLSNSRNSQIQGFSNHIWNGLTSLHFSRITAGVIRESNYVPGVRHLIPDDDITKQQLIEEIAFNFGRGDIEVTPTFAQRNINRSLRTTNPAGNLKFWKDAGYQRPLTVSEMVIEYAQWEKEHSFRRN